MMITTIVSENFAHIVSDKIAHANSADPDQTAPEKSSLIWVYTVFHSTKCF